MQITPDQFLNILKADKILSKSILDIEDKIERIISNQPPIFFGQYTDHGINHFRDTLKMGLHLVSMDEAERKQDQKAVIDHLTPLNVFILSAAVLFHDLGMHIHFNGFKQLINGFYDDVRVDFFNELTWKEEWDNFMIEAKRFSGRERVNLFGDEQVVIRDIDFTKKNVDSDIQKYLIGEFIRRHHGRLAHEIALKGFPVKENDVIQFADDIQPEYKDIFGLIARSHSMNVRDAMAYLEEKFPDDPHFPYSIEVPFLMCVLRIADYFQIDNTRTNAFLIKLKSFSSPFSLNEHKAHLAAEYFKTDEKDPETLYVNARPEDGLMYTKLLRLFDDIQKELDTSFAIIGEMYGRNRSYFKLRYRRIKSNLKNRKEIAKYPYVPDVHKFEADTDLFKLLVGPLYGYDSSYGVREMLQNAVDACVELQYKLGDSYEPVINVSVENKEDKEYLFTISDNGKGMSLGEIKNYYLKAGASFRNSTEWKMDYQQDDNTPSIRRTGKFGIGVLASFLVGDTIEVTTKRYNESVGYTFNADLSHEFIEVRKNNNCSVGTTIVIKMKKKTYDYFQKDKTALTFWYVLSTPKINYYFNNELIELDETLFIQLNGFEQKFKNAVRLAHKDFDDIIWTYERKAGIAINGIVIPLTSLPHMAYSYGRTALSAKRLAGLSNFPFVSVIDRNNQIDFELNRNAIRGELPFMQDLIEQCQLDFLASFLLYEAPIKDNILNFEQVKDTNHDGEYQLQLNAKQFPHSKVYVTTDGYFIDNSFYTPILKQLDYYRIFYYEAINDIRLLPNAVCSLFEIENTNGERFLIRGDTHAYIAVSAPAIFQNNRNSPAIAKSLRERLSVLQEDPRHIVFSAGKFKSEKVIDLMEMFRINNPDAAQVMNSSLSHNEDLLKALEKYVGPPLLIPHDMKKRKAYIKTLHPDLVKYITEKRGVKLD
jgi:molecular chaperone HtpG